MVMVVVWFNVTLKTL